MQMEAPEIPKLTEEEIAQQDLYKNYYFVKEEFVRRVGVIEKDNDVTFFYAFPKANIQEYTVKSKKQLKKLIKQSIKELRDKGIEVSNPINEENILKP